MRVAIALIQDPAIRQQALEALAARRSSAAACPACGVPVVQPGLCALCHQRESEQGPPSHGGTEAQGKG